MIDSARGVAQTSSLVTGFGLVLRSRAYVTNRGGRLLAHGRASSSS
jgi:hypothetical protein